MNTLFSGITLPATPKGRNDPETQLRYLRIDKAGLLDYATMSYTPALRIDYNFHSVSYLTVENSVSDSVNIKYTYPYSENRFEYCRLNNNLGNGFLVRNPNIQLKYSTMKNNGKAGFVYDPFFTEYRALSVRNSIDRGYTTSITSQLTSQSLDPNTMIFLISDPGLEHETKTYQFEVYVSNPSTSRITLQIMDYNPLTSIEKVVVYDARLNDITGNTKVWKIEEDLVDFPIVSTTAGLTISIQVTGVLSGRLTFAAISRKWVIEFCTISLICLVQQDSQFVKHIPKTDNTKPYWNI